MKKFVRALGSGKRGVDRRKFVTQMLWFSAMLECFHLKSSSHPFKLLLREQLFGFRFVIDSQSFQSRK